MKPIGCPCDAFTGALGAGFVERVGDEFFIGARHAGTGAYIGTFDGGVGTVQTVTYGPKIAFCPFCGSSLGTPAALPRAEVRR